MEKLAKTRKKNKNPENQGKLWKIRENSKKQKKEKPWKNENRGRARQGETGRDKGETRARQGRDRARQGETRARHENGTKSAKKIGKIREKRQK